MQEGSFRCDANVSVRRAGEPKLGTRCEIKNLNSFRFMQQAIEFEVRRQIELIEDGGTVVQETRLFDPDRGETRSMRSKEDAQDYRYFPDPDLPPLAIDDAWIERVRSEMPELPEAMKARFVAAYALPRARRRGAHRGSRDRAATSRRRRSRSAGPLSAAASWSRTGSWESSPPRSTGTTAPSPRRRCAPRRSPRCCGASADGTISGKIGKDVFDAMWAGEHGGDADAIIAAKGLKQISDAGAIEIDRRRRAGRQRRRSSPNSARARRRRFSRSSARRWPQRRAKPIPRR